MGRFKYDYNKQGKSLWSGESWTCNMTDRKTDEEYYSTGSTKREAKSNAEDKYWSQKDNRANGGHIDLPTYPPQSKESRRNSIIFSLIGMIVGVLFILYGYLNFTENPINCIVVIWGGILVFVAAVMTGVNGQ